MRTMWSISALALALGCGLAEVWMAGEAAAAVAASQSEAPKRAMCRTCEVRGAVHGEEDVAAWREYEGSRFAFCSDACAEAFDAFPEGYVAHPIPRPSPGITLTSVDNQVMAVGKDAGRATLVDFWATWCAPCIEAMPKLAKLQREHGGARFTVVGISIDEDPAAVRKFLAKRSPGYPVALDSKEQPAWQAFHVAAIPAMFLVDERGRIVAEWRGKVDLDEVRGKVAALLVSEGTPH